MTEAMTCPAPDINPETEPFWSAAREGVLLHGRCRACGEAHYYPRRICPHCGSTEVDWAPASGKGEIYSYSVLRRTRTPYALAWVRLAEGVGLMTNIVECDLDRLAIGQPVELVFVESESGQPVPMFRPAGAQ